MMTTLPSAAPGLADVLRGDQLHSVFQPIVCLDRLAPVGLEALVRGPVDTDWHRPDHLFAAARAEGLVAELDWASRRTAMLQVLAADLRGPTTLFLNAEPEGLGSAPFPGFLEAAQRLAANGVQVVLELTERSLTRDPAQLLRTVQWVRELGWRVALDDVGAERASLALMPLLDPDVIKLDLRLVQARTTRDVAEIVNAVLAQSERTGAAILAEGIETEQHLELARSMGARLGQGWYFGRPGPLEPDTTCVPLLLSEHTSLAPAPLAWSTVEALPAVRTAAKPLLVAMSKTLERQALSDGESVVVLSAFQTAEFFTPDTCRRYAEIAATAAFVGALGVGLAAEPVAGVRGCDVAEDDDLVREWDVAVVGPHFAGALIARERTDREARQRDFDYVLTYDRPRVLEVARSLMTRFAAG